jgi:hypothetical protein
VAIDAEVAEPCQGRAQSGARGARGNG